MDTVSSIIHGCNFQDSLEEINIWNDGNKRYLLNRFNLVEALASPMEVEPFDALDAWEFGCHII